MDRPTFSQSWSRVSRLTPALRPQVQIHRQLFRGEPWHVVHDPVTNNFFRLNPVAYHLVGLLDGRRSVDDAWRLTLERFGDGAPTQNEVIGLLGQLNQANLLRVDLPADAAPLLQRQRRRQLRQWGGQLMSILSLKFPLFNPNRMLDWLLPLFKPVLTRWGLIFWVLFMAYALAQFLPSVSLFVRRSGDVLDPNNWGWLLILFILTKTWHELGHGLVAKRFGGTVPEIGIMLLVLFPAPYVDCTSAWNFSDKWKRVLVNAAGMVFELFIAAIAALLWLHAEPDSLLEQLTRHTIVLASLTTILFNANPLLRFDGYYILADWLEIPNLYQRSTKYLQWLAQRYLFGMKGVTPVTSITGERVAFVLYGILSQIYRVFIMFSIALIVAHKVPTLGILIGLWAIVAWAVIPGGKFVHWLATSPALHDRRPRAVGATLAVAALLITVFGLIPVPERRRAQGVVVSESRMNLAVQTDGFVRRVLVEAGERLEKGQPILVAENKDLEAYRARLAAQLARLEVMESRSVAADRTAHAIAGGEIEALRNEIEEIDLRLDQLVLRSPVPGVLAGPIMAHLEGRFLRRGEVIGRIEDPRSLRVTAMIDQAQNASPFFDQIESVELRTASDLGRALPSKVLWNSRSGRMHLPHPALSYAGGGSIPTRPDDEHHLTATRPQFELWLSLDQAAGATEDSQAKHHAGERVYVRFTLARRRPLLAQWVHQLHQVIRDRLAV